MILGNTNTVAESLYYLLWIKDSGLQESKFPVRIPDTILITGRQITNWYFTNNNDQVLKKKANHLQIQEVYDTLIKSNRKSGIVASIIQVQSNSEKLTKIQQKAKQSHLNSADDDEKVIIKYLNQENLYKFLFEDLNKQELDDKLILQKFIDPYGDSNNCIQAIWSPSTCIFTRCINNRHLNNKQYDAYERAVTFDGPEIFSKKVCLKGKQISGEIRKLCENIVKRIAHVTYERTMINRMTLYFKADINNKLYFLYCTSLRLKDEIKNVAMKREIDPNSYIYNNTPLIIDNNFQKPMNMKNIYTVYTTKPVKLENDFACLNCEELFQNKDMMEIPFSYLMKNNETFDNKSFSYVKNYHNMKGYNNNQNNFNNSSSNVVQQLRFQQSLGIMKNENQKKKLTEVILTTNQIMQCINDQNPNEEFDYEKTKLYIDANQQPPHPLLAKLYPKMTKENFIQLKQKGYFDNLYMKLCHNCYYSYTQNSVITGAPLNAAVDIKEIKRNSAPISSSLFNNDLQRITLLKNYELSKEFDFVKYQRPQIYEQRLELLDKMSYSINNNNNAQGSKKKIKGLSLKEDQQKQSIDVHDQNEIQQDFIIDDQDNFMNSQDLNKLQKKLLRLQQQQQKLLNSNSDQKTQQFQPALFSSDIIRPQTTRNSKSSSTLNLLNSDKSQKRFNLILNLAQKGLNKNNSVHKNHKQQMSTMTYNSDNNNNNELGYIEKDKTDNYVDNNNNNVNNKYSSCNQTTDNDSFSRNKDSILQLYLNSCDQKDNKNDNENKQNNNTVKSFIKINHSDQNDEINNDNTDLDIQQLNTDRQSNINIVKPYLKNEYLQHYNNNNYISRNDTTTGQSSASTYRTLHTTTITPNEQQINQKLQMYKTSSHSSTTSQSYSSSQKNYNKLLINYNIDGGKNIYNKLSNRSAFSSLNRPNTTQNNTSHHIRLTTIQENTNKNNNGNNSIGNNGISLKQLKNPYFNSLYNQQFATHRSYKQSERNNINNNRQFENINNNNDRFNLLNSNRMLKSHTSHSQRIKSTNFNSSSNNNNSPQMNKYNKVNKSNNFDVKRNSINSIISKKNEESQNKKEQNNDNQLIINYDSIQESNRKEYNNDYSNEKQDGQISDLKQERDHDNNQSLEQKSDKDVIIFQSNNFINQDGGQQEQQQNNQHLQSINQKQQGINNKQDIDKESIEKFFISEENYEQQINDIIQDYNQQKE